MTKKYKVLNNDGSTLKDNLTLAEAERLERACGVATGDCLEIIEYE